MKIFILSLTFPASISFFGNVNHQKTEKSESFYCTNCWNYADNLEMSNYGPHGNFEFWEREFNHCNEHLDPCATQIDPVVIKVKKD